MNRRLSSMRWYFPVGLMAVAWFGLAVDVSAIGGRGGGGGGARGGGGMSRGGGGMSRGGGMSPMSAPRPMPRPMPTPSARPAQRPVSLPSNRPTTFPSSRPQTLPQQRPGGFPTNLPSTRPATRPGGGSVPSFGGGDGPFQQYQPGGISNRLPDRKPGTTRPSTRPGNVSDRLPNAFPGGGRPSTLPAQVNPGQLGNFLGVGSVRPSPQKPSWQNLRPNQINNIHNQWNVAINNRQNNFHQWNNLHPDRYRYWNGWGTGIRHGWNTLPARPWFNGSWWNHHHFGHGWWHYGYVHRPWNYWWRVSTWPAIATWFTPWGWNQDSYYYYDYGSGGNVVYEDNRVAIDGQDVCSTEEFAQSAADLASVEPPADDQQAAEAEWLPLGTFSLSTSPDDTDLTRLVQLAVDKEGIISGTLYNTKTDRTATLQGKVDKETQRVAIMNVDRPEVVLETGLYNLTQEEAPAVIHFGTSKSEQALLVRLEEPAETDDQQ